MKFTTLSTAPFINLMVALLLHNSSSSIVAANEDVGVSFSTTTTDNNAVESVIDLNQSRSLGKGSDKKVLSEVLLEKETEYLGQKVMGSCPDIPLPDGTSVTLTNVTSFVEVVLNKNNFTEEISSEGYFGFLKVRGTVGALTASRYDWSLPNTTSIKEDKCEGYEFGVEGEFTKDICAARKKVVAICDKEPTCNEETFNDETFDDSFRLRAAKILKDKTLGGKVACVNRKENFGNLTKGRQNCEDYVYGVPRDNVDQGIDKNVTGFFILMNYCLPEGFNNPLLGSGPVNIAVDSALSGKKVYLIQDGWLSLYKQVTDEINKTSYMDLLIKSTVMRFFAIHWINEKYGISEFKFYNRTRVSNGRQFENVAMESYFMEKYSKDFLTRKEKKDLFKFTDFGEYLVCASHLGAKLAHEECNATAAYEKIQEISISKIRPENVTNNDLICDKYFDENLRNNWRKYAKKVMDKTMTSKCDKKTGKKSSKSEKKASKKLR